MRSPLLLLLFLVSISAASTRRQKNVQGCRLDIKNLPEHTPLLMKYDGVADPTGFWLPQADKTLQMAAGELVRVACPGKGNTIVPLNTSEIVATCVAGANFSTPFANFNLQNISCKHFPERTAENTGKKCGFKDRGVVASLGFRLSANFVSIVQTCFDQRNLSAIYSNYTLVGAIGGKASGGERPAFRTGGFYGKVSPNRQYEKQNATLASLLGPNTYLRSNALNKGHLSARAGFVFWAQKRATFFYVNAAPQWRTINAGNWAALEKATRRLAAARGDLLVITGTHGVLKLNNSRGQEKEVYLTTNRKILVPKLFWKVVYDAQRLEGVALVASNNPFTSLTERLCPDVCARIQWLQWNIRNRTLGEGYCCEVNVLRRKVPDIPLLQIQGLLSG